MKRLTRSLLTSSLAAFLLAGCALAEQPAASPLPPATVRVARATLVDMRTVPGTLSYGDPIPLSTPREGMITWLPPVGETAARGEPLFRVNEQPVVALYGAVPLYRTLGEGAEGADVRQLQENLAALGYRGFTVNGVYTSATAQAVRAWQRDTGVPETGEVELGQALFVSGPVRIAGHSLRVGDGLRGMPVLSYTSTTRQVTLSLPVADRTLVAEEQAVTVRVPGLGALEGMVSKIAVLGDGQQIDVTVSIVDQESLGALDAVSVEVDLVHEARADVLVVPVSALLALTGGGYGLEVVQDDGVQIVPVRTGMFAAGLVEVSGEGIDEGVIVGVPR